jgi:hypothetical protein
MELEARVSVVLPAMSGVSQASGNQWMSQEYVFDYFWFPNQSTPSRIVMKVFGEDKIKQFNLQPYDEVKVRFHIEAHEYNGRWFNETRIDGVTFVGASASKTAQQADAQAAGQQQQAQQNQSQQQGNVLGGPQTPPYNSRQPFPPQVDANGNPTGEKKDDLPF